MEILGKLRNLDAYPKVNEDFYSRTLSGGLITILSSIAILFLFLSEISELTIFFCVICICLDQSGRVFFGSSCPKAFIAKSCKEYV